MSAFSFPDAYFLAHERRELVKLWTSWLGDDRSAIVGTLRFQESIRSEKAERLFDQWMGKLQAGNRSLLEWRGGPRSPMPQELRFFHVLIRGLDPCNLNGASVLWRRIAGRASLHLIDPEWIGLQSDEQPDRWESESGLD